MSVHAHARLTMSAGVFDTSYISADRQNFLERYTYKTPNIVMSRPRRAALGRVVAMTRVDPSVVRRRCVTRSRRSRRRARRKRKRKRRLRRGFVIVASLRPRAAHTGHTTTEDEDGGYWATTEPEDAWTTDANEEGPRSESRGRAGPGQATDDARRAWLDAGENPTASDADADADAAAAAAAASPSVTSFPTPRPRGSSRALVDAEPDESEGVTGEASEASEASEDEERASVASSSPGESSNRIVAEARAAASEDERPAAADDDDDSASDSETGEDSF